MDNIDKIDFLREHQKLIKVTLRNSRLTENRLQQRCNLMRKSFKNLTDKEILDKIESEIIDRINTTGKANFSEDDIDEIMSQALGLEIRNYDKSHLVDLDKNEILSIKAHGVLPEKSNGKVESKSNTHEYGDTVITTIGRLTFKDWTGLEDYAGISCYAIGKKDKYGKITTYPNAIFSRINFSLMDSDPKYREAVLYFLLDENNIKKTKCGGYVGSIQTVEEGKSLPDTVNVNEKYSLVFDETDATVVVKFRKNIKEKQEQDMRTLDEER